MTPCKNFVFIQNGVPSLFAKRPEMNCLLLKGDSQIGAQEVSNIFTESFSI